MADCGLLTWQPGINLEGEEARTELLLLDCPELSEQELTDATARLKQWRKQHGRKLNTGSSTGIRDVAAVSKELSKAECQKRARARARDVALARRGDHRPMTKTAPPCGTSPALQGQNTTAFSSPARSGTSACGLTTGAHTRASASDRPIAPAAMDGTANSRISGRREPNGVLRRCSCHPVAQAHGANAT